MATSGPDIGTILNGGERPPSNILVLAPALSEPEEKVCMELLSSNDISRGNVLSVTFTQSVDDRLELWEAHVGDSLPPQTGFISVGGNTRSETPSEGSPPESPEAISVTSVSNPADLTGLGMRLTNYLTECKDTGNPTALCFHSLTPLIQYVDLEDVFRFLHILTGRIESMDAVAHYHLDPSAHDEQTRSTLLQLFDATLELDADGNHSITQR